MQPDPETLSCHRCPSDIHLWETSLRRAKEHYSSLRTQFQQLREEFRFNLDVLAERDLELHRYEFVTSGDCRYKRSIPEQKGPPALQSKTETSENIHEKMKSQLRVQENNNLSHDDDQRHVGVSHEEQLKEVDKAIAKLQAEMDTLSAQAMSMKTQHQQQLQEREDIIDRYKKQLGASLEREKHLEQKLVQKELEWQNNCEDIQSKHYLEHERLIQELTAAREKVNAELMETKDQLQQLTVLLQCVTKERDQALQGCILATGPLASEELAVLQEQNFRLQSVVSEMRKQMEELSRHTPPPQHCLSEHLENKEVHVSNKEDVQHLETNITRVKEKPQRSSVCSCGRVSINSTVAQWRSRLKQAASCIARLNRDRQQLIELCNRLRAQVNAAPSQSHKNTANQTIHRSTDGLKSEENGHKGLSESVGQDHLSTLSSPQNCSRLLQAHQQSEHSLPSLTALWAQLDQGHLQDFSADLSKDPAEVPPKVLPLGPDTGGTQMEVSGVVAQVHKKSTAKPPQKRGQLKKTGKFTQSARIRNYNIKD